MTVKGPQVQFLWVPAHSDVEENEKANTLARSVTAEKAAAPPTALCVASYALSRVKDLSAKQWAEAYAAAKWGGKHTRDLDKALAGAHTKVLYNQLPGPKPLSWLNFERENAS